MAATYDIPEAPVDAAKLARENRKLAFECIATSAYNNAVYHLTFNTRLAKGDRDDLVKAAHKLGYIQSSMELIEQRRVSHELDSVITEFNDTCTKCFGDWDNGRAPLEHGWIISVVDCTEDLIEAVHQPAPPSNFFTRLKDAVSILIFGFNR